MLVLVPQQFHLNFAILEAVVTVSVTTQQTAPVKRHVFFPFRKDALVLTIPFAELHHQLVVLPALVYPNICPLENLVYLISNAYKDFVTATRDVNPTSPRAMDIALLPIFALGPILL
jgi:hypothetical protein